MFLPHPITCEFVDPASQAAWIPSATATNSCGSISNPWYIHKYYIHIFIVHFTYQIIFSPWWDMHGSTDSNPTPLCIHRPNHPVQYILRSKNRLVPIFTLERVMQLCIPYTSQNSTYSLNYAAIWTCKLFFFTYWFQKLTFESDSFLVYIYAFFRLITEQKEQKKIGDEKNATWEL